jgi:sec-independent protein translocase protein TatC
MTDISKYLDFVLTLFFAFGMAFEIPVATIILVVAGVVTPEGLAAKREYVIVGAFVIGAILTPPDVISQFMMAVPIWLLFELGLLFSRFLLRQRPRADDGATAAPPQGPGPTLLAPPTAPSATTAAPPSRPWSPPGEGLGDQLARQVLVGAEIDGGDMNLPGRFVPLTPEQMDAELDAIEGAESRADRGDPSESEDSQDLDHNDHPDLPLPAQPDPGESRLQRVQALRDAGDLAAARALLYEVLETGDADQRMVAHNILGQLDTL